MRRLTRPNLPDEVAAAMADKQAHADAQHRARELDIQCIWRNARGTKPLLTVLKTLKAMTGIRERCMYCSDSHGTDIEHFWPKVASPRFMYHLL